MSIFGKRKRSGVLGRPHAGPSFQGQLDPFDPIDRQELESERTRAMPGSSTGIAIKWIKLGRLKIPIGFRVGLSLGKRFGFESQERKKYNEARRGHRFRSKASKRD